MIPVKEHTHVHKVSMRRKKKEDRECSEINKITVRRKKWKKGEMDK
jgi:hypothetical protein